MKPQQLLWGLIALMFNSCVTHRDIMLLNEGDTYPDTPMIFTNFSLPDIQINDILFISIDAEKQEAIRPYTRNPQQQGNQGVVNQNPSIIGYLVNTKGEINYPGLGNLKVAGYNIEELELILQSKLEEYISNFTLMVRILNFKIQVMGEVNSPGPQVVDNQRITIIEAINQAGGLTTLANADQVQLHRELDGVREHFTINLHDRNLWNSPLFYLKQNDIIYVLPVEQKTTTIPNSTRNILPWIGLVASALNLYFIVSRL